ncbi:MAG: hypothetical protein KZY87_20610 [Lachnospiraceae bacterium]|nr:hypothetical protein [Lachnospiraceae bacterium]
MLGNIEMICEFLKTILKAEKVEYVNDTKYPNAADYLHMFEAKYKTGEILEIKYNEGQRRFFYRIDNKWCYQDNLKLNM